MTDVEILGSKFLAIWQKSFLFWDTIRSYFQGSLVIKHGHVIKFQLRNTSRSFRLDVLNISTSIPSILADWGTADLGSLLLRCQYGWLNTREREWHPTQLPGIAVQHFIRVKTNLHSTEAYCSLVCPHEHRSLLCSYFGLRFLSPHIPNTTFHALLWTACISVRSGFFSALWILKASWLGLHWYKLHVSNTQLCLSFSLAQRTQRMSWIHKLKPQISNNWAFH